MSKRHSHKIFLLQPMSGHMSEFESRSVQATYFSTFPLKVWCRLSFIQHLYLNVCVPSNLKSSKEPRKTTKAPLEGTLIVVNLKSSSGSVILIFSILKKAFRDNKEL